MTNTTVSSGVTSSGIALTVGDTMTVLSGGTAIGAVDSGGTVTVSAGGTVSGTTLMIGQSARSKTPASARTGGPAKAVLAVDRLSRRRRQKQVDETGTGDLDAFEPG